MTVGTQVKQAVVSLKGAQATIRHYEQHSRHADSRKAYHTALNLIGEILGDLEARQRQIEFEEPQYQGS